MKNDLRIEIDFTDKANSKLSMREVMALVDEKKKANPDREYYMSGNYYAIVSKPRVRA